MTAFSHILNKMATWKQCNTVGNHVVFYTYIRTERIRNFVIISLIFNASSYGKAQIPHRFCSKLLSMRYFHACCSFPHNLEQRQNVFARGCVENYSAFTQNFSVFLCCLQIQGISTSPHQNSLNIKEAMNNFLTHPVRIQVQNNQNRSRDSRPWCKHTKSDIYQHLQSPNHVIIYVTT